MGPLLFSSGPSTLGWRSPRDSQRKNCWENPAKLSRLKQLTQFSIITVKPSLTTALQSRGSVPKTSRSFHYWQPAQKGQERGNNLWEESPCLKLRAHGKHWLIAKLLECLVAQEHMESWCMRRSKRRWPQRQDLHSLLLTLLNHIYMHLWCHSNAVIESAISTCSCGGKRPWLLYTNQIFPLTLKWYYAQMFTSWFFWCIT